MLIRILFFLPLIGFVSVQICGCEKFSTPDSLSYIEYRDKEFERLTKIRQEKTQKILNWLGHQKKIIQKKETISRLNQFFCGIREATTGRLKKEKFLKINDQIEQERLPTGEILIRYFEPVRPLATRLMRLLGRKPEPWIAKKLQLDIMGSEVWALIDSRRSVQQIIDLFSNVHRLSQREAEAAVTQFLRSLGRRGLIALH